ncbi:MAG TPA: EthD family reductase [Kofleriaceae bacterium]|nr:EthD family reductase [Kofleriaceae bacterium]
MINVNVLYPNKDGAKFDMSYYLSTHIPLVKRLMGGALKGVVVEQGLGGGAPGTKPEFSVLCTLRFDSVEAFQTAFGPHASTIQNDIPNYSNVAPVIQISDVKLA